MESWHVAQTYLNWIEISREDVDYRIHFSLNCGAKYRQ
jgi:hypothetical protein